MEHERLAWSSAGVTEVRLHVPTSPAHQGSRMAGMEVVARMTSVVAALPLFFVALGLMVVAIPLIYLASGKIPPAWRWLMAYIGLMGLAVSVLWLA